jgi:hypothetical protein
MHLTTIMHMSDKYTLNSTDRKRQEKNVEVKEDDAERGKKIKEEKT